MDAGNRLWLKALLWAGVFLGGAFAGDRILAVALDQLVLQSEIRYSRLYRGGMAMDVVVLGDSRGVNSFLGPRVEKETGLSVINLAHNGVSTEIANVILRDYLQHNAKPKMLVLDVSNVLSASDLVIQNFQIYQPHSEGLSELLKTYAPDRSRGCRLAHLYRFNNEIFLRSLFYLNHNDQNWVNRNTIGPALLEKTKNQKPMRYTTAVTKRDRQAGHTHTTENLKALRAICDLAAAENIELRLILSPYLPLYQEKIANYEDWLDELQAAAGPQAPPIRDYAAAVEETNAFGDRLHLNETGAREFLNVLLADGFFELSEPNQTKEATPLPR